MSDLAVVILTIGFIALVAMAVLALDLWEEER